MKLVWLALYLVPAVAKELIKLSIAMKIIYLISNNINIT
jgi:hypothetical protein